MPSDYSGEYLVSYSDKRVRFALIGQPNVGKSALFTRLTGVGVISSNYPGTTVEFEEGTVTRNGVTVSVHDLPGTFGLSGNSDDEKVVLRDLYAFENDSLVVVLDSTNLENGLVLCYECLELGLPTIVALTKFDVARKRYNIDIDLLSKMLGVPVIAVSSKTSEGVDALADAVCEGKARISDLKIQYDPMIEKAVDAISDVLDDTRFSVRGCAVKMMENSHEFNTHVDDQIVRSAGMLRKLFKDENGQSMAVSIASSRYSESKRMVEACVSEREVEPSLSEKISDLTITPSTGIPILIGVCLVIVFAIVQLGTFLDGVVNGAYDALVGNVLIDFGKSYGDFWGAVFTGIDGSIRAILALVIPYIMVFYIILGILEDSGYLTRAVVLLDKVMHHFGLHGGAFIPMIVGIGCNVPAIMAVRTVKSRREKIILSSMIVMAVPCSAQIAIIMGATGTYSGFIYALMIFGLLVLIGAATGVLLNKFMKYEPSSLAMELPELVLPSLKNVFFKTWNRIKDFFYVAFPLLVVGSIIIEILLEYDLLRYIVDPLSPVTVGLLGLPAVCSIAFIVGILRKEMALGMLTILAAGVPLAEFLTPDQFVVFGTVMAIYMPCVATLITMWHEIGWKETVAVSILSITMAILAGTGVRILLGLF